MSILLLFFSLLLIATFEGELHIMFCFLPLDFFAPFFSLVLPLVIRDMSSALRPSSPLVRDTEFVIINSLLTPRSFTPPVFTVEIASACFLLYFFLDIPCVRTRLCAVFVHVHISPQLIPRNHLQGGGLLCVLFRLRFLLLFSCAACLLCKDNDRNPTQKLQHDGGSEQRIKWLCVRFVRILIGFLRTLLRSKGVCVCIYISVLNSDHSFFSPPTISLK